ncbi:glycosyltransferase [Streptomyces broussonetiae]|uniref:D-inositol 3-phosphate glycosyltransferase n=1 Tax=Streptomyces broussonetiae TaxID=2686304 RepID=A0A6I6N6H9_9ACTN|nr:glycosyltransferase [Streptomyces broussonetiae]QHA08798.1 glycosyltransferase [Streptomyces broussonetiae]
MKITFLLHNAYGISGTVRATANLAGALADHHDVEIVSYYRTADQPRLAAAPQVRMRTLVDLRPTSRHYAGNTAEQRRSGTVCPHDTVHHGPTPPSGLGEARLAQYLKDTDADVVIATRPYLTCFLAEHGRPDQLRIGQEYATRALHPEALRDDLDVAVSLLDAYVSVSAADTRAYRRALHSAPTRLTSIPVCAPAPCVQPSTGNSRTVVTAGRLTAAKRYDRLVDAFAKVVAVHPDWTLRIYGRGHERSSLRRRVDDLGLHDNVQLMGVRTPLDPEWAKGAIAVLPSSAEPSGTTLLEAMSCGVPVVSTDCDHAPREIITHGEDGLLVPAHGAVEDTLADALCRLIENDAERRRMAAAAHLTSLRFRPRHIAAQYDALFADLKPQLAGRGGGGTALRAARPDTDGGFPLWRRALELIGLAGLGAPVRVGCRVLPDGSVTFHVPSPALTPDAWNLVLRPRETTAAGDPVRLRLEQRGTGAGRSLQATLDKASYSLAEGHWDAFVQHVSGNTSRPVLAGPVETARLLDPAARRPSDAGCTAWIPCPAPDGGLALRTWHRPAHAEVSTVTVGDSAIRITGSLHGSAARSHHYRFRARLQGHRDPSFDGHCYIDAYGDFDIGIPLATAAEHHPGADAHWDLRLSAYGGPELRLGMLTGDIADRRDITTFPTAHLSRPRSRLTFQPYLTPDHDLALRTTDA